MNNDRTCALHIATNSTYSSRTKHIALRFSFLRELVKNGRILIHHVGTHDSLADVATKYLANDAFYSVIRHIKDSPR